MRTNKTIGTTLYFVLIAWPLQLL